MYFSQQKEKHCSRHYDMYLKLIHTRGISILGEVRNVAISRPTQQLLWYKFHDFLAVFALAYSKINDYVRNHLNYLVKP